MIFDTNNSDPAENSVKRVVFRRFKDQTLAQQVEPGDGIDPKYEARSEEYHDRMDKADYSAQRLARQIQENLELEVALPGLPGLDGFAIAAVQQKGTSNCFVVRVYCTDPTMLYDLDQIQEDLNQARGHLRSLVARGISRKRVPDLVFEVLPPGAQP